jgi:glycosyltransferase involved in cell wall biosynthesis
MKLAVYCPAIGQQETLNETLRLLATNAPDWVEMWVIDNASKEPLQSKFAKVIRNEENRGMVGSLRQAVEHSTADIIAYLHSDMYIHEENWDREVLAAFEADPKLAALGVVGAKQADANGGRSQVVCAFRDAEKHGSRPKQMVTPVALLDGCFCAYRRSVLQETDFDQFESNGYFFYDKDISISLTMASHHVAVINLDCEHLGGTTSCRPEFTETLHATGDTHDSIYERSERRYLQKWKDALPVRVTDDYVVHAGRR